MAKVLITDKDGVLNFPVLDLIMKWGYANFPKSEFDVILKNYLQNTMSDDEKKKAMGFFKEYPDGPSPMPGVVDALLVLRKRFDKIVMLTNSGDADASVAQVAKEVGKHYPKGLFDKIISQGFHATKLPIYQEYIQNGNSVTIIDDSPRHIQAALDSKADEIVATGEDLSIFPKGIALYKSLADYVNVKHR